ncbi:MAG: mevalonate kinase [Gammaproteobacteria bacterium]
MSYDFQTTAHGKWILAGEHAVIREHPALVFPVLNKTLSLAYQNNNEPLAIDFSGLYSHEDQNSFWRLLQHGFSLTGYSASKATGKFFVTNNIPIGVGIGSSAAICTAASRWFSWKNLIDIDKSAQYDFARQLENLFHGDSSGLDIAGTSNDKAILFRQGTFVPVVQSWQPHWYLSFAGNKQKTILSVQKVQDLWKNDIKLAKQIDRDMTQSVHTAQLALASTKQQGLPLLAQAINQARQCFNRWGLIRQDMQEKIDTLMDQGSLAVKPTGAGNGGYILSLWAKEPEHYHKNLIRVSNFE